MRRALPQSTSRKQKTKGENLLTLKSKAKFLNDFLELTFQDWKLAILKGGLGGGGEGDGGCGYRCRCGGLFQFRICRQRRRRVRLRRIRRDCRIGRDRRRQLWCRLRRGRGGGSRGSRGGRRSGRGQQVVEGLGDGC